MNESAVIAKNPEGRIEKVTKEWNELVEKLERDWEKKIGTTIDMDVFSMIVFLCNRRKWLIQASLLTEKRYNDIKDFLNFLVRFACNPDNHRSQETLETLKKEKQISLELGN